LNKVHKGITQDGNTFKVVLSSYFSSADAPRIVYFETNDYGDYGKKALSEFSKANKSLLVKSQEGKIPVRAYFPFLVSIPVK